MPNRNNRRLGEDDLGKRGPKPGARYGPRNKGRDNPLRQYWRLQKRRIAAKKRGDMDAFREFDRQLKKLKRFVTG